MSLKLEERQELFARHYVIHLNAVEAAKAAGYAESHAKGRAWELLRDERVQELIEKYKAERNVRLELDADAVIRELQLVAFARLGDAVTVDDEGNVIIRDVSAMPETAQAALTELAATTTTVENVKTQKASVKLAGKLRALELLMQHMGLLAPEKEKGGASVTFNMNFGAPASPKG